MIADPQEHAIIPVIPSAAAALEKVDPSRCSGPLVHRKANEWRVGFGKTAVILVPDLGEKPLACCEADGEVWQAVIPGI